jgi:hypothetical protein
MFIQFDSNQVTGCDDCGNPGSIMHMSVRRSESSVNLCVACLRALAFAIGRASSKLRL